MTGIAWRSALSFSTLWWIPWKNACLACKNRNGRWWARPSVYRHRVRKNGGELECGISSIWLACRRKIRQMIVLWLVRRKSRECWMLSVSLMQGTAERKLIFVDETKPRSFMFLVLYIKNFYLNSSIVILCPYVAMFMLLCCLMLLCQDVHTFFKDNGIKSLCRHVICVNLASYRSCSVFTTGSAQSCWVGRQ